MVYFANLCVNLRACLCDVARYVSAQSLDFLDLDEISSFLDWKHRWVSIHYGAGVWMDTALRMMICDFGCHTHGQMRLPWISSESPLTPKNVLVYAGLPWGTPCEVVFVRG